MSGYDRLRNEMGLIGRLPSDGKVHLKEGIVTSYDPEAYAVKIMLQPEEIETGWLPIETAMAGQGWGAYFGPAVGDQALAGFIQGDLEHGSCLGFLPSDEDRPPKVESGEIHLVHKGGAYLKFTNDGKVKSKGAWEHEGTLKVSGDITDNWPGNAVTIQILRSKYNAHAHGGVQTGGGVSGGTNQPAT